VAEPSRGSTRTILTAVALTLGGVVLLYTLYLIRNVLLILYISALLALGFSPMVRWLEGAGGARRGPRIPRWAAILLLYIGLAGVVAVLAVAVVPPLANQATELWKNLPTLVDDLQGTLVSYRLIPRIYGWAELARAVPSPGTAMAGVLAAIQGVFGVFGTILSTVVLPYYLLLEGRSIGSAFLRLFAPARRRRIEGLSEEMTTKISAWLGGQMVLSFVIGVTAGIGLYLIGIPYFYVLALICAFGELIPVVGPVLAAVPAVIVAFTASPQQAVIVIVYFAAQQFIENNFLVPRIMERQVGVSAVTVIVALLIGTELLGIVGALLAVPTAAIIQVLVEDYLARDER